MKKILKAVSSLPCLFMLAVTLASCGQPSAPVPGAGSGAESSVQEVEVRSSPEGSAGSAARESEAGTSSEADTTSDAGTDTASDAKTGEKTQMKTLKMKIGDTPVAVDWENNESVAALAELVKDNPLTIRMSMYGGFEQVGSLGTSLPKNDKQTTAGAGDIVLYSGNQIVVFYGSNSWAYTRLGHVSDKTAQEMKALLGNGDVTITVETAD